MKQPTAPSSPAIKVITGGVLALNAGFYVGAFWQLGLLVAGVVLSVVLLGCYI
jgi:hypothetical protein